MAKPLSTMMRPDDVACGARDLPQRPSCARRVRADALLDQAPRRFDRVVVVRVRRQKLHGGTALLDELSDRRRLVGVQVVEQDDVSAAEPWRQSGTNPV